MSMKIDWKKYDDARPKISVRISKKDKQALDAALQQRGESASELLLNCIEPVITQYKNELMHAAAPDMLEVLEELDECAYYWSQYDVPVGIHDRIKSAIAKAKGEQP
jgi:hypothetical protein